MTEIDYSGKTVLITGGAKGVGLGITQSFLQKGAQVIICGRTLPKGDVSWQGNVAKFFQVDVRDYEQLTALVSSVIDLTGTIDVLINNAGGSPEVMADAASPRFSEAILKLNLLAPLNLCQIVNRVMQEQDDGGSMINIASVSGIRASPGTSAYGAAKAGLINLTKSLAIEWAPKVRINSVILGPVLSEAAEEHLGDAGSIAKVKATIPMGRLANPSDVGGVCLFLGSTLASYITGSGMYLDGGGEKPAFMQVRS